MIDLLLAAAALLLAHFACERVEERARLSAPRLNEIAIDRELYALDPEFALELGYSPPQMSQFEVLANSRDFVMGYATTARRQRDLDIVNNASKFARDYALKQMALSQALQNAPHASSFQLNSPKISREVARGWFAGRF